MAAYSIPEVEDLLPLPGPDRRPAKPSRFALVSASDDGFQFVLEHMNKKTLVIASSLDASELLGATATNYGRMTADGKPCSLKYPFPVQGFGIRDMTYLSGPMITLRSEFEIGHGDWRGPLARLETVMWLWPSGTRMRDRRSALSARETLLQHPVAKTLLVVEPATAAMWQGEGWPMETA